MHFSFTEIRPCFASFLFVFCTILQLLCKTVKEQASINNNKNWFIGNEKSLMDLSSVKKDFVFSKRKFCFADEWTLTILYNTEANTVAKSSKIHFANSVKHCGHNWEEKI